MKSGHPVSAKHAELERRSAHQLRLRAVEMLRSSTQLVKSYGAMEKNAEYGRQPEILAPVHVIERPITFYYEDSDKGIVFGEFFTDRPSTDIIQKKVTTKEN